jgi:hypothetical protein
MRKYTRNSRTAETRPRSTRGYLRARNSFEIGSSSRLLHHEPTLFVIAFARLILIRRRRVARNRVLLGRPSS